MLIDLPIPWLIVLNITAWLGLQLGMAWLFTRLPLRWFETGHCLAAEGALYDKLLLIKRWKHWLPDGAVWVGGDFAKARLRARDAAYLRRFAQETWRGELCHWAVLACTPVFLVWNPAWTFGIHAAYALVANLPCVLVQRHNRARLQRVLGRRGCGEAAQ